MSGQTRQQIWRCFDCGGDSDPSGPDVRCIQCHRSEAEMYNLGSAPQVVSAQAWACPHCSGVYEMPPEPTMMRCIGCGRTLCEWTLQQPRGVTIITETAATDLPYERREFVDYGDADSGSDD